jgi:hypothetical protein
LIVDPKKKWKWDGKGGRKKRKKKVWKNALTICGYVSK